MIIYQYPYLFTDVYVCDHLFNWRIVEYSVQAVLTNYSLEKRYPFNTTNSFYRFLKPRFKLVEESI